MKVLQIQFHTSVMQTTYHVLGLTSKGFKGFKRLHLQYSLTFKGIQTTIWGCGGGQRSKLIVIILVTPTLPVRAWNVMEG